MPDPTFSDVDVLTSAISSETAAQGNTKTRVANAIGYLKTATVNGLGGKLNKGEGGFDSGYIYVSESGSDETGDGSPGNPFASGDVAWAAATAAGHTRLQFAAGTYQFSVDGTEAILRGSGRGATNLTVTVLTPEAWTPGVQDHYILDCPDCTLSATVAARPGADATTNGEAGGDGQGVLLIVRNASGSIDFTGGAGGTGYQGVEGEAGDEYYEGGGPGGTGGTGGKGSVMTLQTINSRISASVTEGSGGNGGTGGTGGIGGMFGNQGPGGQGGDSGENSSVSLVSDCSDLVSVNYSPGSPGSPGAGGSGGIMGSSGQCPNSNSPSASVYSGSIRSINGGQGIITLRAALSDEIGSWSIA